MRLAPDIQAVLTAEADVLRDDAGAALRRALA